MTKRLEDGGRAKVLTAARTLVQQKGFHQTAMAELSVLAGVSIGQIYRLFANKDDLIVAIVEDDTNELIAELVAVSEVVASGKISPRDGFRRAVSEAMERGEEALTFEFLAEGFRNPATGEKIGRLCERYRAILCDLILSVDATLSDSRLAAAEEMLLAILFGLGNRTLSRPRLTAEETADHAADMILSMLKL